MSNTEKEELEKLRKENAYLKLLLWKMSVAQLADQHPKYRPWVGKVHVQEMPR